MLVILRKGDKTKHGSKKSETDIKETILEFEHFQIFYDNQKNITIKGINEEGETRINEVLVNLNNSELKELVKFIKNVFEPEIEYLREAYKKIMEKLGQNSNLETS